jgi:hypothetical protein
MHLTATKYNQSFKVQGQFYDLHKAILENCFQEFENTVFNKLSLVCVLQELQDA